MHVLLHHVRPNINKLFNNCLNKTIEYSLEPFIIQYTQHSVNHTESKYNVIHTYYKTNYISVSTVSPRYKKIVTSCILRQSNT